MNLLFYSVLLVRSILKILRTRPVYKLYHLYLTPIMTIIVILFSTTTNLHADVEPNNDCSQKELIGEMDNISENTTHTETGTVVKNQDEYDIYYFKVEADGTLQLAYTSNYNTRVWFSKTACRTDGSIDRILENGTSVNSSLDVDQGDIIYITVRSRTNSSTNYSMTFRFTKSQPTMSADLALSETTPPSKTSAETNENITFSIHVVNNGPDAADTPITLKLTYTLNVTIVSTDPELDCTYTSGMTLSAGTQNICRYSGAAFGAGDTYDATYTVQAIQGGTLKQTATISSASNDHVSSNNTLTSAPVTITSTGANQPPTANNITKSTTVNTPVSVQLSASDPEGDSITYTIVDPPQNGTLSGTAPTLTYTPSSSFTGTDTFTYKACDNHNNCSAPALVSVTVYSQDPDIIEANDDNYIVNVNSSITFNVLDNDIGEGLEIVTHTDPTKGTLVQGTNGSFTYTHGGTQGGQDYFTYTIKNSAGYQDTATVTIDINGTVYTTGSFLPFYLINPQPTRNVVGDYKLAGNTVLCLTEKTDGYGGTCQGDNDDYEMITSNMHVTKYLDIDDDGNTWNSTSSYIKFPETFYYDTQHQTGGILWAGLFWQGRLSADKQHPIHYAESNSSGSGYHYVEIGKGNNIGIDDITMANTGAPEIKLKVDDNPYRDVDAETFHVYESSNGKTYDAFADVTDILRTYIQQDGNQTRTFTVANLTTMEGREESPGAFGGWSLVVIYAEDYTRGKARNLSIYNGFISIGTNDTPIEISGFKLPTTGDVNASLSVFSGEGEYLYGRNPVYNNSEDWMKISNQENTGYQYMPGVPEGTGRPNRDNMFDAILYGIERAHVEKNGVNMFNDQRVNNVGVDVDYYDVSELMTGYRDSNPNINTIYIQTYSNNDYITPGMIAFSAQLYQPEVCYDYVVKRNEFLIPSDGREYNTTVEDGDELSFTVAIRSMEGDMDLQKSSVAVTLSQAEGNLTANVNKAYYSVTNSNTLRTTPLASMSLLPDRPVITVGKGRTPDRGGTISPNERYFTKFYYDYNASNDPNGNSRVSGHFNIEVNATMNFGSGDFWQILHIERCAQNQVYSPPWYRFNVERDFTGTAPTDPTQRYSLPTRIAGRDFNYSVAAYTGSDYSSPSSGENNITIDVEMINIDAFDDNQSYFKCSNPDPTIIVMPGNFVHFDNTNRVNVEDSNDLTNTYAIRSATFRMWFLLDSDGNIIQIPSDVEKSDNEFFAQIYEDYYAAQDTGGALCGKACNQAQNYDYISPRGNSYTGCYACLRDYFAQPKCARDNFAIRPKAIRMQLNDRDLDGNQSALTIAQNDSNNEIRIAAGYPYELRSTTVKDDGSVSPGYYFTFQGADPITSIPPLRDDSLALHEFNTSATCADESNRSLSMIFNNGGSTYRLNHDNVGRYIVRIWDSNWTKVDRAYNNPYKTVFDDNCKNSASAACNDCTLGTTTDTADSTTEKVGCSFGSDTMGGSSGYTDLVVSYWPYKFKLAITQDPGNAHPGWLYLNDLNQSLDMAVKLEGKLIAQGADDSNLSNFTDSCVAQPVFLWTEGNVTDEVNTAAPITYGSTITANGKAYQIVLKDLDYDSGVDDSIDTDNNLSLEKNNFEDDENGTADIDIYINFERSYNPPTNPITVYFRELNASSPGSWSNARKISNHVPDGNVTLDNNRTFYYAQAKPSKLFYDDINETSVTTPISVLVYSDDPTLDPTLVDEFDGNFSHTTDFNWYLAVGHSSSDGNITLKTDDAIGTINNNNQSEIDLSGGTQENVTVSYNDRNTRPHIVNIDLNVSETAPWLIYNPDFDGVPTPFYRVRFVGNGGWLGHGKTGHVVDSNASRRKSKRLEW